MIRLWTTVTVALLLNPLTGAGIAAQTTAGASGPDAGPAPTPSLQTRHPERSGRLAAALSPASTPSALLPEAARTEVERSWSFRRPAALFQARDRSGIPYMVAGGALFVAGAFVGDTGGSLLMVGGAGIGAYGLFVYFGGDEVE